MQQYSVDLQRELPGAMAVTVSYIGARGDHLPLGGTVDTVVNINQLDPKYLRARHGALSAARCPIRSSATPRAGALGDAGQH